MGRSGSGAAWRAFYEVWELGLGSGSISGGRATVERGTQMCRFKLLFTEFTRSQLSP
jgi:hypothetical protein